jgi:hypothetical protein
LSSARSSCFAAVAIVAGLALGACSGPAPSAPSLSPGSSTASESPLDWGPLAVANQFGPDAHADGTLVVDGRCVNLLQATRRTLLVWPSERTEWDPQGQRILFERSDGSVVEIESGDNVGLGGGFVTIRDGWVAPPDEACPAAQWMVSNVTVAE